MYCCFATTTIVRRTFQKGYTYIDYVAYLYRTVWKWLRGSTDRTYTDPLQASVLTHTHTHTHTRIIRLQVSKNQQYPAIYSQNYDLICSLTCSKLSFSTVKLECTCRRIWRCLRIMKGNAVTLEVTVLWHVMLFNFVRQAVSWSNDVDIYTKLHSVTSLKTFTLTLL